MSLIVDEHRQYLEDETRVSAFRDALSLVVRPGDIVVDLGSGTAIQSLLACRAGAARVYAIDAGGISGLARDIVRRNGLTDRVTFVRGLSTRVELPERADVVTGDQIGRFGFEAGLLDYWIDARRRFLRPGGRLVPAEIELWTAPVEMPDMWERIAFWRANPAGFDFGPAADIAVNTGYPARAEAANLVAAPWRLASIALATAEHGAINGRTTAIAARRGVVHGLAGWFNAVLAPGVTMTNAPTADRRINRAHVFLPLERPLTVEAGEPLDIDLRILPRDLLITWSVSSRRPGTPPTRQSTLRGMLLSREELRKSDPSFVPRLTPWGRARQTVLALCDGARPLRDIEHAVRQAHPDLFPTDGDAASFVAEVVHPYSE